jgi:hypothetical protein
MIPGAEIEEYCGQVRGPQRPVRVKHSYGGDRIQKEVRAWDQNPTQEHLAMVSAALPSAEVHCRDCWAVMLSFWERGHFLSANHPVRNIHTPAGFLH